MRGEAGRCGRGDAVFDPSARTHTAPPFGNPDCSAPIIVSEKNPGRRGDKSLSKGWEIFLHVVRVTESIYAVFGGVRVEWAIRF